MSQAFSFDACDRTRTRESSSSRLLGLLAYEVKPTIALTMLELENSTGTIDEFFNSYYI